MQLKVIVMSFAFGMPSVSLVSRCLSLSFTWITSLFYKKKTLSEFTLGFLTRCYFFASSKNWHDVNFLQSFVCKSFRVSSIRPHLSRYTFVVSSPVWFLLSKPYQKIDPIVPIYTWTMYFFWHHVKSLHRLVSGDGKK